MRKVTHFGFIDQVRFPEFIAAMAIRWFSACLLVLCTGCSTLDEAPFKKQENLVVLLNPESELGDDWEYRRLRGRDTDYDRVNTTLGNTIQATGNGSASIMFRLFEPIDPKCNRLRWSWYVSRPQPGSDLHTKGMDDVAASVFILFGDPGIFRDKPVPTLKYVWANHRHRPGEIIAGPYHKKYVRTVIVRTGAATTPKLFIEQTNLSADYLNAFGETLKNGIYGVAIFTDNDDTKEPIIAHYGRIELRCKGE